MRAEDSTLSDLTALNKPVPEKTEIPKLVYRVTRAIVVEASVKDNKPYLTRRGRKEEEKFFFFWHGEKQVCLDLEEMVYETYWLFTLKQGKTDLDSFKMKGTSKDHDKFVKRGNNIYIYLYYTKELHLLSINEDKFDFTSIGKSEDRVISILEVGTSVFFGTTEAKIKVLREAKFKEFALMTSQVTDMKVVGDTLWAVDWAGQVKGFAVDSGEELNSFKVCEPNFHNFFSGEDIVCVTDNSFLLIGVDGKIKKEQLNPIGKHTVIVENNDHFAILSRDKTVFIWHHETQTFLSNNMSPIVPPYILY